MKKKSPWLPIVLLLILAVAVYQYLKPVSGVTNTKPHIETTARQLLDDYTANETEANNRYLGKVVQVSGTIMDKEITADNNITVLLGTDSAFGYVSCLLQQSTATALDTITTGSSTTIKGICTGFLITDVQMNQCIIIPNP